ncbi:SIMPL domain-containing protein [uncultured Microbacterium sp.]|uniref:SIMPL domain-containing protein n=1 Tax=uncultured Microbacterium sp. TaxID=191216 RepID=UPI002602A225|nr:SIMPL domain-containing protein [uncultured Microbacterium sp.]
MSDVTITVRGDNEIRVSPERATIHLTVSSDGHDRAAVVTEALRRAEPLRAGLEQRVEAETLVEWSSNRLSVRGDRPWNNEGKRLATVYRASVDFTATFAEASELSLWVSEMSGEDGLEIGHVSWALTPHTRARIEQEVAAAAVGVAVARAEAYATALGLTSVVPQEIADVGMISAPRAVQPGLQVRAAAFAVGESAPAMSYEPDDIVVSATVEARFTAS